MFVVYIDHSLFSTPVKHININLYTAVYLRKQFPQDHLPQPSVTLECFFQLCWAVVHQKALHSVLWTFCLELSWEMSHNVSSIYRFPSHLLPTESPLPHLCTVGTQVTCQLASLRLTLKIATACPLLCLYFPRMMLTSKL